MYAFNLKTMLKFSYLTKTKIIVVSHSNGFTGYTFLGLNLFNINSSFASIWPRAKSSALSDFMKALNEHRHVIQHTQNNSYGYRQLQLFDQANDLKCKALSEYRNELIQLRDKYSAVRNHIILNLNEENLFTWIQICCRLNIIESIVWSKIFSIVIQNFSKFNSQQKAEIINYSHGYVKGKFMSFTYAPSKFIYRQNYLVDITNFRTLLKLFVSAILKSQDNKLLEANQIEKLNDLIEKISKSYVFNFQEIVILCCENKTFFERLVEHGSVENLIESLKLLSVIGYYDEKLYSKIENKIAEKCTKNPELVNEKFISRILAIWAIIYHHNQKIFNTIVKPFIAKEITNNSQSQHHSIWLFNMVACNIRDFEFLESFERKIANELHVSNKYLHIVSHYIAVMNDKKKTDAYPMCTQHPTTSKIISKHGKIHLNCMNRQMVSEDKQQHKLDIINERGSEENPSEKFWFQIVRNAFEIISKRYPHPDNCIHVNFPFCVFKIDILLMIGGKTVAFQLGGSHYNLKDQNEIVEQVQGKKEIKQLILNGYGIHMLNIKSANLIQHNLNSFGDKAGGIKYILEKLENILQQSS